MEQWFSVKYLVGSLLYSLVGFVVFAVAFFIYDRLTPGDFKKEIFQKQNVALAIVMGAVAVGLSIIIASAIHG